MRSAKSCSHNRLIRIITIPFRILSKAKNFYINSLNNCADRVSYGSLMSGSATGHFSTLPKSFSVNSSRPDDSEDLREFARSFSIRNNTRSNGNGNDEHDASRNGNLDLYSHQDQQQMRQTMGSRKVPRSCSVGMGRIDEDKAYDYGEENNDFDHRSEFIYPRSRSHAVHNRSLIF